MKITEKQKQDYLFRLMTPLCEFDSLLPGNIEIALKIYLTSPERYFSTKTAAPRPRFKILSANLLFELILIKDSLLQVHSSLINHILTIDTTIYIQINRQFQSQAMESRLAKSALQINFLARFVKSFR